MTPEQMNQYCREEKYLDEYLLILYAKEQCPDCISKLWDTHVNMVRDYVRRRFKKTMYFEVEELVNESYFFFLDAIRKFEIDKGHKFSTFLHVNLQQLSRYVIQLDSTITRPADYSTKLKRDETTKLSSMSMDELCKEDGTTFSEMYEDENAEKDATLPLEKSEGRAYLDGLLSSLTPMQARIVRMRYLEGLSIKQCCLDLNTTEFKLKKATEQAMRHLRLVAKAGAVESYLEIFERD